MYFSHRYTRYIVQANSKVTARKYTCQKYVNLDGPKAIKKTVVKNANQLLFLRLSELIIMLFS
ncbi:hypothetical protein Pta6605_54650 [Pseudomonas amygdali pv. tabaci]|nr:hypothetical protein Pta6605_54650 [Pseudomonas amygdali pv. tabaci]